MHDGRDLIIRKLKEHLAWIHARAYATLEDMKGADVMEQLGIAKECLEKFAESFDETLTPEERKKYGLEAPLKVVEDDES